MDAPLAQAIRTLMIRSGFLGSCSKPLERITQRLIEVEYVLCCRAPPRLGRPPPTQGATDDSTARAAARERALHPEPARLKLCANGTFARTPRCRAAAALLANMRGSVCEAAWVSAEAAGAPERHDWAFGSHGSPQEARRCVSRSSVAVDHPAEKLQQRKLQEELALAAQQEKQAPLPSKAGAKPPA